ncbi:MAG TPA: tyrosine-type recombinase/integrase [Candidatus Sulfotelmatobacter sp.]|nr:tyrosine-type recombinase/integrase [Candidatus Sulfotelmatobacter sp.]
MPKKPQYSKRAKILKYVKVGDKWRFANVVEERGKPVRDHVLISGVDEHHPEGTYYIEWYEIGGRRRRQAVEDFQLLLEEARLKALHMEAMRAGVIPATAPIVQPPPPPVSVPSNRLRVETAIDKYLEFIENHRSPNTYKAYRYTLDVLLRQSCGKQYVDDISRDDMLKFMTHCYSKGLGHRTVYDKLVVALQMFKRYDRTKLILPSDWPNYVEKIRPIYEPEEIMALLKHSEADERIFLKFMLASGFRDREAQFLTWRDLDFHNSVVRVTTKPMWRFKPKNWEERSVPLPTALIEQLAALKEKRSALPAQLVFPNSKGRPNGENDMIVKYVAERAKLNCGQCITKHGNRCSDGPHCQHFFLHKFRHTFATEHLRHGIDIRTLQIWMGHRDIQSTMVYLKGVQSKDALAKVNAGALAAYVV